jgi:Kef-type K+ transport system membrane component KefB
VPRPSALPRSYPFLVVVPILLILLVLHLEAAREPSAVGETTLATRAASTEAPAGHSFGLLLAQILVVLVATRACGLVLRPLGQPQVVGEMLAGILLGPSLFGLVAPATAAALFPPSTLAVLGALSQVGMVLYMFLVGMDLDTGALRERGGAAVLTSHVSIAVPFAMGTTLALALFRRFAPPGVAFAPFALFLGAAMSVTAFPVLARILAERGLMRTSLGTLAMSAAAVDDVTAWTILAAITVYVRSAGAASIPWASLAGLGLFVFAALLIRRPLRRQITGAFERSGGITHGQVATFVALALAGAWITEALGVHALFGAFFMGLMLSTERQVTQAVRERLEAPLVVVLLPLYFAFTGLRTRLDLLVGPDLWGIALVVIVVAVAGKLGASALAARVSGVPGREAIALGVLMNTRGLMELVILNIGLDLGVLSPALFSIMVLMAFATTLMTSPLLSALRVGAEVVPGPGPAHGSA